MKLTATLARSLKADLQAELRDIERAVSGGTREAGRGLKAELRRQVAGAGLGQRLANGWRDKHDPDHRLDAASLVYTKAPRIIRAFDEGSRKSGELRGFRRATDRAHGRGEGLTTVVMFLLVPQVKRAKRLNVARAADRWSGQLPALIEQQLRSE